MAGALELVLSLWSHVNTNRLAAGWQAIRACEGDLTHPNPWDHTTQVRAHCVNTVVFNGALVCHDQVGGISLNEGSRDDYNQNLRQYYRMCAHTFRPWTREWSPFRWVFNHTVPITSKPKESLAEIPPSPLPPLQDNIRGRASCKSKYWVGNWEFLRLWDKEQSIRNC
jgi:hypothetical protein